jgi:cation:H+ antiporter
LPFCLALCLLAVIPPLVKGKFYRWQGAIMLAVYAAYVVLLVV